MVNKNYRHINAVQENRILMYDVYIIFYAFFLIHYNYILFIINMYIYIYIYNIL